MSIDTGLFLYSSDVKFYETVLPFKMKSNQNHNDPNSVLSQTDHSLWSDPFSYDEVEAPDNMNENIQSNGPNETGHTPSNISSPSGNADTTPKGTDTTLEEGTYIPWVDEEVLGLFD